MKDQCVLWVSGAEYIVEFRSIHQPSTKVTINSTTISIFLITDMTSDTMLVAGALNSRFMVNISKPLEIFRTAYR
jgi:hypothetical protein